MKIYIKGCGSAGQRYIYLLNEINPNFEIVGIRSEKRNPLANSNYLNKLPKNTKYSSLKDIRRLNDDDHIIISSPSRYHFDDYMHFRNMNINSKILIEKPIGSNYEECDLLSKLKDKRTYVSFQYRYASSIRILKEILPQIIASSNGIYCSIYHSDDVRNWHPWENHLNSYSTNKSLGGGCTNTLNHCLDIANYLFGDEENMIRMQGSSSSETIDCDDWQSTMMQYRKNKSQTFTVISNSNYFSKKAIFKIELIGFDLSVKINLLLDTIEVVNSSPLLAFSNLNKKIFEKGKKDLALKNREKLFKNMLIDFLSKEPSNKLAKLNLSAKYHGRVLSKITR